MNIKHKFECDNKEKIERSLGKFCTTKDSNFILTTIIKERLPTRGDLARRGRLLECVALVNPSSLTSVFLAGTEVLEEHCSCGLNRGSAVCLAVIEIPPIVFRVIVLR
ncbi:hypothetical protein MTR_3g436590 [Medicago truncatula]|uniref:Uncharacterized protein n=1 Tax=Medicago truncatula TaxID=3880 RepID=G8A359_MEDTR|nr:hypothetical protein MTR_3g436590 [Medicago truncatula]